MYFLWNWFTKPHWSRSRDLNWNSVNHQSLEKSVYSTTSCCETDCKEICNATPKTSLWLLWLLVGFQGEKKFPWKTPNCLQILASYLLSFSETEKCDAKLPFEIVCGWRFKAKLFLWRWMFFIFGLFAALRVSVKFLQTSRRIPHKLWATAPVWFWPSQSWEGFFVFSSLFLSGDSHQLPTTAFLQLGEYTFSEVTRGCHGVTDWSLRLCDWGLEVLFQYLKIITMTLKHIFPQDKSCHLCHITNWAQHAHWHSLRIESLLLVHATYFKEWKGKRNGVMSSDNKRHDGIW